MISSTTEQAFNDQVRAEMYSFYLYLAMSTHFKQLHLDGMAGWMRKQATEEMTHAMKFIDNIEERGGTVRLQAIIEPKFEWTGPLGAFTAALEHEKHITGRINDLMDKAVAEKDHASASFLKWFVDEQVEEEAALEPIVDRLRKLGDSVGGLYYLDHQLGKR